jgi:hypothetical protein
MSAMWWLNIEQLDEAESAVLPFSYIRSVIIQDRVLDRISKQSKKQIGSDSSQFRELVVDHKPEDSS